jgi:hypothetical protein
MSNLVASVSHTAPRLVPPVGAEFPVFPAEAGILSMFRAQPPFGRENGEANQTLSSEFP